MNAPLIHAVQETKAEDPLWYKDAIIYQLHIKSYFDSNNDGVGDFPGLLAKLDYIADLGVNTVWLLPFYPSPRRDDGYDIGEYRGVHPEYGSLRDVKRFIAAAHERGIRVITELVINHTSDQHQWFQRARQAKPGSAARNFYVWSDDDRKYAGTRIIFLDTERSNWSWDPVAKAYFWHRFYSHQPDLNFDNPAVLKAVTGIMRFWLEMGVDGLRLDAVPYLVEREGTNNENLPETHAILRKIRAEIDGAFPGRMLLAEANQWPEDIKDYFGSGDECHMAFHFPLMPRMYMALAREDRFPVTDIMRQTPDIPENCQWAIFLRNHDELTLEMVSDSERDYLWDTYAADRRARINLGIRRRLAPLLERDRRRVELLNCLLLSMPGAPVIYYGDEIGMGDNIHLGDRDGVRTPMQWSPDRNGGFSRADPATLVLPPIMDPLYGYETVNVESQLRDPHSLLHWMRRMLAVRRRHSAFGRGSLRFLYPKNRKILAYLREYQGETILCVANVSGTPQAVELDLSERAGCVPVELSGGSMFPPIGQLTYLLTLPPYGFYWFLLTAESGAPSWHTPAPEPMPEFVTIVLRNNLAEAIPTIGTDLEKEALPTYLAKRRWFAAKDQRIARARLKVLARLPRADREMLFCEVSADTQEGGAGRWLLPLSMVWENEPTGALPAQLAVARVRSKSRVGFLTDAFSLPSFTHALLRGMESGETVETDTGVVQFRAEPEAIETLRSAAEEEVAWLTAEQSNSSVMLGDVAVVKLFRRIVPGQNPEAEMTRFLTRAGFANAPLLLGEVEYVTKGGERSLLAVAQSYVRNQGDAWTWMLHRFARSVERLATQQENEEDQADDETDYNAVAAAIGTRLGEMHAILAQSSNDQAFAPKRAGAADIRAIGRRAEQMLKRAFDAIGRRESWDDAQTAADVKLLLSRRRDVVAVLRSLAEGAKDSLLCRIHGDFHLGQVLLCGTDAYIIDFEGEPARTLDERRAKQSPLRDVAGLLRSIDYVAAATLASEHVAAAPVAEEKRNAFITHLRDGASRSFLDAYAEAIADRVELDPKLLSLFLIEKAAYEVGYEAANRPSWLHIPVRGLLSLLSDPESLRLKA